jgi:hypothetical protein
MIQIDPPPFFWLQGIVALGALFPYSLEPLHVPLPPFVATHVPDPVAPPPC